MEKVGIITIIGFDNYGNRLQNYALQETIKKIGFDPITINNQPFSNTRKHYFIRKLKNIKFKDNYSDDKNRRRNFVLFNKKINITTKLISPFKSRYKDIKTYVVGSDQVWNPYISRLRSVDLLDFKGVNKKIAYSASFSVEDIPDNIKEYTKSQLEKFNAISVREYSGKKIVEKLTNKKDVEVLVDPTLLLSSEEWEKIAKKPEFHEKRKYILLYFLGNLSKERKRVIENFARENECEIINILDRNSEYYSCGPSEFLYLEKNAFLICTDSFHSSVFAFIFNKPFIIFRRDEDGLKDMSSRLDTLLEKFKLSNRKYNEKDITMENINYDYTESFKILDNERYKGKKFLKNALGL